MNIDKVKILIIIGKKFKYINILYYHMNEKRIRKTSIIKGVGIIDTSLDVIKKLIYGRQEYSPSAQKYLVKYYYNNIIQLEIRRSPLEDKEILNNLTNNELDRVLKSKDYPQEDVYHISLVVVLDNGVKILVEKTENVIIEPYRPLKNNEQQLIISVPHTVCLGDFMENTREKYGNKIFFSYRLKTNNCGNFVEYLTKTNNLYKPEVHKFIFQDAPTLLKDHPYIEKSINFLTDLKGRFDVIQQGGSIKKSNWIEYVKQIRTKHNLSYKDALIMASKTFKK